MRLFESSQTYKTQDGAIKKLKKEVGEELLDRFHWHIGVTSEGRFYPVVTGSESGAYAYLASYGVCVS